MTEDRSIAITVRPMPIVAEIAQIAGHELRIEITGGRERWAVVTEAGPEVAIQALFDSEAQAREAAQALENMVRAEGGPKLATSNGERLQ